MSSTRIRRVLQWLKRSARGPDENLRRPGDSTSSWERMGVDISPPSFNRRVALWRRWMITGAGMTIPGISGGGPPRSDRKMPDIPGLIEMREAQQVLARNHSPDFDPSFLQHVEEIIENAMWVELLMRASNQPALAAQLREGVLSRNRPHLDKEVLHPPMEVWDPLSHFLGFIMLDETRFGEGTFGQGCFFTAVLAGYRTGGGMGSYGLAVDATRDEIRAQLNDTEV